MDNGRNRFASKWYTPSIFFLCRANLRLFFPLLLILCFYFFKRLASFHFPSSKTRPSLFKQLIDKQTMIKAAILCIAFLYKSSDSFSFLNDRKTRPQPANFELASIFVFSALFLNRHRRPLLSTRFPFTKLFDTLDS